MEQRPRGRVLSAVFGVCIAVACLCLAGAGPVVAQQAEEPGEVSMSNVELRPDTVTADTTNEHTLTFDVSNVSPDGEDDVLTLTYPNETLVSTGSISAVDADGDSVAVESSVIEGDTTTVTFTPFPIDGDRTPRDITVTVENATVAAPNVTNTTDVPIQIDFTDSANGQASANATLTTTAEEPDEGGNGAGGSGGDGDDDSNSGTQSQTETLTLHAVDVPETVQPNSTFSATYEVENAGEAINAYTIEMAVDRDNVTVTGFSGDIQSSTVDNQPPSASTDAIAVGARATVTISYQVAADTTGNTSLTATTRNPLSGANTTLSQNISIQTTADAPDDPTQRALQITGKSDPRELTQNDVTAVITRFNRGQSVNNVTVTQDDVTATITLFERN